MKTIIIMSVFLLALSQTAWSQGDTLVGVLRDAKNKPVRDHWVTLGLENAVSVKTNRHGMFTIPGANLNDTLYIEIKKDTRNVFIPVKGYNYLTIDLTKTDYEAERTFEPTAELKEIMARERNKMISSSVMNKSEIEQSRCNDIYCILRRLSGVSIVEGAVKIQGGNNSLYSSTDALIVVDGIAGDNSLLNVFDVRDIEQIEALKNATQYGARGANGAIVITTRKK